MSQSTTDAFRALSASLTKDIAGFAKGWHVKYVDWDDCSRAEGSCLGDNITDVFMKYFKDGAWRAMFVVGTENYNPTGVHIRSSKLKCIIQDFETGDSRVGTVQELLRDTGKIFERRGLDSDVTLLADGEEDPYVFYKVNVAVVPCSPGETVDTAIFGCNYQAYHTSRNAMLLCNGQTTGLSLDKPNFSGQSRYVLTEYNKEKDEWREFATTTDVSKRTIAQCGTETEEEARQAIAEGKTAEVPLGPEDAPKSSAILSIQVPINQQKLLQPRAERAREPWSSSFAEGQTREKWLTNESLAEDERLAAANAAAEASHVPKKLKPTPPGSPVSSRMGAKVTTRLDAAKEQLPEWGSPGFGPIGTGGSAAEIGAAVHAVASHVKEALDDEEPELVALSPDDHSRPAGAPLENDHAGYVGCGDDDSQPNYCSLGSMGDDSAEDPAPAFRSLGAEAESTPARGGGDMGMGGIADALPALMSQKTKCKMGRFFKGPYLGKLAPLQGTNLVRDPAGCPTAVQTIVVTCPVGEEPTETDVKELIKLAHKFLQCAANCEGSKVNSLFSEFSKKIGQVTESISPKAAEGIIQTVKAMSGSLPAGIF